MGIVVAVVSALASQEISQSLEFACSPYACERSSSGFPALSNGWVKKKWTDMQILHMKILCSIINYTGCSL